MTPLRIRRRRLSALLAAALLPAFPSYAQKPARRRRIGTLTAAWAANHPAVEGLRAGLAALGMNEGREIVFEHRFTQGDLGALDGAAAALIAAGVDLIFTTAENATLAAARTTRDLPIVFSNVGDPVASGIVRELAHPGGNVTGVTNLASELVPKRLALLKELAPNLHRVWAIHDIADAPESRTTLRNAQGAARTLKLELLERPVRTPEELQAALAEVRAGDGIFVYERATSLNIGQEVLDMALKARALTTFSAPFWVQWGALMTYGADYYDVGFQAARLVTKILAGTPPRDIPVEGANKIQLVINGKVAKALGLSIPPAVLLRADRVIE